MKKMINDNGVIREMTAEEIAEMQKFEMDMPIPTPTPEERIATLEQIIMEQDSALMELAAMLTGGV